jgi:hypothetical protein
MSSLGGGNGYQAFSVNGLRRGLVVNDKVLEPEGNRSGNLGFAMTEKDIDERVCFYLQLSSILLTFWGTDLESGGGRSGGRSCQETGRARA